MVDPGKNHQKGSWHLFFIVSLQIILEIQEALQVQFAGNEVDLAIVNQADPLFLPQKNRRVLPLAVRHTPRLRPLASACIQSVPGFPAIPGAGTPACRPATGGTDGRAFTVMIDRSLITRKISLILGDLAALTRHTTSRTTIGFRPKLGGSTKSLFLLENETHHSLIPVCR